MARVRISNADRVIFPDAGYTKGDLADYYAALGPAMLPFVSGRPVSLVRCPRGTAEKCFFQKHHTGGLGAHVRSFPVLEKGGESQPYLWLDCEDGLLECVQMGTIEFHPWASGIEDIEKPDRLIFDLDPDEGMPFAEVRRAAQDVRDLLAKHRLTSFAMLTGGKGVHVIAPLTRGHSWDAHHDFARALARHMADTEPDRFTATMRMEKRKGKVFIDWLRNSRGATAIAPWSARARPGAPVALPVAWDDLPVMENAQPFSVGNVDELRALAGKRQKEGWGMARQKLPAG